MFGNLSCSIEAASASGLFCDTSMRDGPIVAYKYERVTHRCHAWGDRSRIRIRTQDLTPFQTCIIRPFATGGNRVARDSGLPGALARWPRWGDPLIASGPRTRTLVSEGELYRTFSVARPTSARISEMIQKRMTICGSAQPFFS